MSFEWNKIAGAVLFALLVVFGLNVFSDILFEDEVPEVPGYVIAVAEDTGEGGETVEEEPIAVLLASASAEAGEGVAKKCVACHSFEQGGGNKVGPALWDVLNRPVAAVDGFGYSGAMVEWGQGKVWDYDHMNGFLLAPKQYVPGTAMGFAGLKDAEDRADIIAYLRTLSDSPAPLPDVPVAEAEAPTEGDAATEVAAPADPDKTQTEVQPAQPDATTSGEIAPAPTQAEREPTNVVPGLERPAENAGEAAAPSVPGGPVDEATPTQAQGDRPAGEAGEWVVEPTQ